MPKFRHATSLNVRAEAAVTRLPMRSEHRQQEMQRRLSREQRRQEAWAAPAISPSPRSSSSYMSTFTPSPCLRAFASTFNQYPDGEGVGVYARANFTQQQQQQQQYGARQEGYSLALSLPSPPPPSPSPPAVTVAVSSATCIYDDNGGHRDLNELFPSVPTDSSILAMTRVCRPDKPRRIALSHHYHVNAWLSSRNNQTPFVPVHCASNDYDMKLVKYVVTSERRDDWLSEHEDMWRELSARCSWLLNHLVYILFPEVGFLRDVLRRACCSPGSFRYGEVTCENGLTYRLHVPSEFFLLFWLEKHANADANANAAGSARRWASAPRSLVESFCSALRPLRRFAFNFIFDIDQLTQSTINICIVPLLEITRCATTVINNLLAHVVYVQAMVT